MPRSTVVVVALVAGLAGCYRPDLGRCAVLCQFSDACPDGWTCRPDKHCHAPDDPGTCPSEDPDGGPPPSGYVEISAGSSHTCAIDIDGNLWCWGYNNDSELGSPDATGPRTGTPSQVQGAGWTHISTGQKHTCGMRLGAMYCWGRNDYGQTGQLGTASIDLPTQVGTDNDWIALSAGDDFTCGIRSATDHGRLYCWGHDDSGQLGDPGADATGETVREVGTTDGVDRFDDFVEITAGINHGCARRTSGDTYCFGSGQQGRLGVGDDNNRDVPTLVGGGPFAHLSASGENTCALGADASLWCWGSNGLGQLGHSSGFPNEANTPLQVGVLLGWTAVSVGAAGACGVLGGHVYCWGGGDFGEIGDGRFQTTDVVTEVIGLADVTAVTSGDEFNCALTGGNAFCWGDDADGQLGTGTWATKWEPTRIGVETDWDTVSAGDGHTCAIRAGHLYCWGLNFNRQLGVSAPTYSPTPIEVTAADAWLEVAVGDRHTCATRQGTVKELWCWGDNLDGQVGQAVSADFPPTMIDDTADWHQLAASPIGNCALRGTTRLCWGQSFQGALGNGGTTVVSQPTVVASESISWTDFEFGKNFGCGVAATDLYCWGSNDTGQQGRPPPGGAAQLTPMLTSSLTMPFTDVAAARDGQSACAINAGVLECWGDDGHGQLGVDQPNGEVDAPMMVPGSGWSQVSAGLSHVCAVNDLAELYCAGSNINAQLGDESLIYQQQTLARIDAAHDWARVSAGSLHTCAITTGHELYCWGWNTTGVVGDGTMSWPVPQRTAR